MLTAIIICAVLQLVMVGIVMRTQLKTNHKLETIAASLVTLQSDLERPGGAPRLGRTWPSPDELAAAKNRIDAMGVAHPGRPN